MAPKQQACPNPLFLKWLEELKIEAQNKDLKTRFIYAKAINSIKKYPLPLRSGKEARILENIGDGIANHLDAKLAEFIKNGGDLSSPFHMEKAPYSASTSSSSKLRKRKSSAAGNQDAVYPVAPRGSQASDGMVAEKSSTEYIPVYRSGAYAIIVTLYEESLKPGYPGYMSKEQLLDLAQERADRSFVAADTGSHYTAWSSMGTLIRKGLVAKKSSPAKYSLTPSGITLALKLLSAHTDESRVGASQRPSFPSSSIKVSDEDSNVLAKHGDLMNCLLIHKDSFAEPRAKNHLSDGMCLSTELGNTLVSSPLGSAVDSCLLDRNFTQRSHSFHESANSPGSGASNGDQIKTFSSVSNVFRAGGRYVDLQKQISAKASKTVERRPADVAASCLTELVGSHSPPNHDKFCPSIQDVDVRKTSWKVSAIRHHAAGPSGSAALKYYYVSESGECFAIKDRAFVSIDDDIGLAFLVKAEEAALKASGKTYKLDPSRAPVDGYVFAYLADADAPEVCSMPDVASEERSGSKVTSTKTYITERRVAGGEFSCNAVDMQCGSSASGGDISNDLNFASKVKLAATDSSQAIAPCVESVRRFLTGDLSASDLAPEFTLRPGPKLFLRFFFSASAYDCMHLGLFDVILLVDFVETTAGGSTKKKKELSDLLHKSGVMLDVRKLQVGDFLWIAKEKFGNRRELVLDFIVERKRMDDLAGSITDGRFREQKFRLKTCGLKHAVYMVEKYGSMEHLSIPESTLRQAITNTQVVDKLFVKETSGLTDSVDYLVSMTKQLTMLFKDKTLHAIPAETVKLLKENVSLEMVIQNSQQYCMTFEEFSSASRKNKVVTVKEIFARQLMQVKGVSVDRALSIVQAYPTPALLLAGYEKLQSKQEKENMLASLEYGKSKRKVGAAISRQLYLLYATYPPNVMPCTNA